MKKTLNINLNNVAFIIDEDAYEVLRKYLADIAGHFQDDLDRDDIMADIEGRIAELLGERLQRGKEVVTLADVQEVVAIMGHPSQFADDEEQPETQAAKKKKRPRRFYRDPEGAVLGGVCGGIAARFGWDVSVVRLALAGITLLSMVVGGGWFFLLAYFLLWIVAPAAVTPSQRLEMQGEEVTVDNIKAEFDNWKAYVAGEEFKRSTRTVGQRIGQVLVGALKVCLGVAGALLVAAVVFVVFIAVVSLLSVGGALSIAGLAEVLPDFVWSWPDNWDVVLLLVVSGLLLVGCPLFALVYAFHRGAAGEPLAFADALSLEQRDGFDSPRGASCRAQCAAAGGGRGAGDRPVARCAPVPCSGLAGLLRCGNHAVAQPHAHGECIGQAVARHRHPRER